MGKSALTTPAAPPVAITVAKATAAAKLFFIVTDLLIYG
jgi:hypothetical protein